MVEASFVLDRDDVLEAIIVSAATVRSTYLRIFVFRSRFSFAASITTPTDFRAS
jgi:hypothetical protein